MPDQVELRDLAHDLAQVRKNEGLLHPDLRRRAGPALRRVCDIEPTDTYAGVRQKIMAAIDSLADEMDNDLFMILRGELHMLADCPGGILEERQVWLATKLRQSPATIRKRGEKARSVAASLLAYRQVRGGSYGYNLEKLVRTSFFEGRHLTKISYQRTIRARADGLAQISMNVRLTSNPAPGVAIEQRVGCDVVGVEAASNGIVQMTLELPQELTAGEQHVLEYCLVPRNPVPAHSLQIYFWTNDFQPHLTIRAQFSRSERPNLRIVDGLSKIELGYKLPSCEAATFDRFGMSQVVFDETRPGRAYGLGGEWQEANDGLAKSHISVHDSRDGGGGEEEEE